MKERHEKSALIQPRKKNPLSVCILNNKNPKSLEKPLKPKNYDMTEDPDENIEHVDNLLDYYHADRDVKFKIFALTLTESTLA